MRLGPESCTPLPYQLQSITSFLTTGFSEAIISNSHSGFFGHGIYHMTKLNVYVSPIRVSIDLYKFIFSYLCVIDVLKLLQIQHINLSRNRVAAD